MVRIPLAEAVIAWVEAHGGDELTDWQRADIRARYT